MSPAAPLHDSRVALAPHPTNVYGWVPPDRALHLVDVENLCGCSRPSRARICRALSEYRETAGVEPDDHVIIGCHPARALDVRDAWPGSLIRVGHGPDGADLAILSAVDPDDVAHRYFRVYLGSGDGIFAPLLHDLRIHGVRVAAIARPGAASRRIRQVARVRYLDAPALH